MNIKIGDTVKYKSHYLHYKGLGDKHPQSGAEIKTVRILAPSKNTEFTESDWIVCYPKDYPIIDLRSHSNMKHWGIGKEQIIEVIG